MEGLRAVCRPKDCLRPGQQTDLAASGLPAEGQRGLEAVGRKIRLRKAGGEGARM